MANFNPPFSNTGDRRNPTSDERQNGFGCGPADRELFNGLYHRLESEIGEVITFAGIDMTDDRNTQLREAIVALIDAATGGGDPSQFVLMAQARGRLPIFPEVQSADGRITVIPNGTGSIRLPGGVTLLHRGIFPIVTAQTDFATTASRNYHLRWNPTDGFQLKNLADTAYNPGALAESNIAFDSTYDDVLLARVVTNSANVATITNLANKASLSFAQNLGRVTNNIIFDDVSTPYGNFTARRLNNTFNYNFARTPVITSINAMLGTISPGVYPRGLHGAANAVYNKSVSRYFTKFDVATDVWEGAANFYCEIDFQTMV